jgi:hypothetical protein
MNNLILAMLLAAVATALCLRTQSGINTAAAGNAELAAKVATAEAEAAGKRIELRRWESIATSERSALNNVQDGAARAAAVVQNQVDEGPSEPAKEGYWPAKKEYFYLSKKHLRGVSYSPVTEEENISDTAALLFGMSSSEKRDANEVYHRMREEMRALELASAYPTNTPSHYEKQPGIKTTIYVPKLSDEELGAINTRFASGMQQALGTERADMLVERIQEVFKGGRFAYDSGRTFTIVQDGGKLQYSVNDGRGGAVSGSFTPDNGDPDVATLGIPRDFAHLFLKEKK